MDRKTSNGAANGDPAGQRTGEAEADTVNDASRATERRRSDDSGRELPDPDQKDGIPANGTRPVEPQGPDELAPVASN